MGSACAGSANHDRRRLTLGALLRRNLHHAARNDEVLVAKGILSKSRASLHNKDRLGQHTALHTAAYEGLGKHLRFEVFATLRRRRVGGAAPRRFQGPAGRG